MRVVLADASLRDELCGHKLRDRDKIRNRIYSKGIYSKVIWPSNANRNEHAGEKQKICKASTHQTSCIGSKKYKKGVYQGIRFEEEKYQTRFIQN